MKIYTYCAVFSLMLFTVLASSPALSQEMAPPFQSFDDVDIDLKGRK
tara:strand:+ start:1132 stop:1272 length:141 start_codon:yes stop_codon:yes gene_type:complete